MQASKLKPQYKPHIVIIIVIYFAGSWLVPVERFLHVKEFLLYEKPVHIEAACFAIILTGSQLNLMTRDYFDFEVIHLSSTTNMIPTDNINNDVSNELLYRMNQTVQALNPYTNPYKTNKSYKKKKKYNKKSLNYRWKKQTIAIIVFSELAGSNNIKTKFTTNIRRLYFIATFWSIYRYIPNIIVTTMTTYEQNIICSLNLPIYKVINVMSDILPSNIHPSNITEKVSWLLPQKSLLYVMNKIENSYNTYTNTTSFTTSNIWGNFKYVYYSEGDLILHMRNIPHLYNTLDIPTIHNNKNIGGISLIPHRMQTIPLPQSFPEHTRKLWSKNTLESLENVTVIIEDYITPRGSCCDHGRFHFADCNAWW